MIQILVKLVLFESNWHDEIVEAFCDRCSTQVNKITSINPM